MGAVVLTLGRGSAERESVMRDVIVVGAGMGGLAAANELAAKGLSVLVLEGTTQIGGKARTQVVDGVEFDTGPSVLTLPEVADSVFRASGSSLEEQVTLLRPTPNFRYVFPSGVELDVHHELEETCQSVRGTLGATAEHEFRRFLNLSKRIWDNAAPAFVFQDAPSVWGVFRQGPVVWASSTRIDAFKSMKGAIEAVVKNEELRALLLRYATYNGSDPRRAPGTLNCIAHVELGLGGFGIQGGMGVLANALANRALDCGAEIELGSRVSRIELSGKKVTGVKLEDGRFERAEAVVVNAAASHLLNQLLPEAASDLSQGEPSMSGWTAIHRARRVGRAAHTVLMHTPYLEEFEDIFDRNIPPVSPTVYLCAQEVCHQRVGWADREPVFVMANAPALSEEQDFGPLRAAVIARLKQASLWSDGDDLVWERTPWDLAQTYPHTQGSIYGMASHGWSAAFRRPPNRLSGFEGVYLASGSAHPGGGVPLALQSGRLAARALLKRR